MIYYTTKNLSNIYTHGTNSNDNQVSSVNPLRTAVYGNDFLSLISSNLSPKNRSAALKGVLRGHTQSDLFRAKSVIITGGLMI